MEALLVFVCLLAVSAAMAAFEARNYRPELPWPDRPMASEAANMKTELALVSDDGWAVHDADRHRLPRERWWTTYRRAPGGLLVADEDGLLCRYWCVYEVHGFEPRLFAAIPVSGCASAVALLRDVPPLTGWRSEASYYRWNQVPAYVDRSLAATIAWIARNSGVASDALNDVLEL